MTKQTKNHEDQRGGGSDKLTLTEIADKADAYANELGSVEALKGVLRIVAQNIREASPVPAAPPQEGRTPASQEIERLVEDLIDATRIFPDDTPLQNGKRAHHAAALLSAIGRALAGERAAVFAEIDHHLREKCYGTWNVYDVAAEIRALAVAPPETAVDVLARVSEIPDEDPRCTLPGCRCIEEAKARAEARAWWNSRPKCRCGRPTTDGGVRCLPCQERAENCKCASPETAADEGAQDEGAEEER